MQIDESRGEQKVLQLGQRESQLREEKMKLIDQKTWLVDQRKILLPLLVEKQQKPPSPRVVEIGSMRVSAQVRNSNSACEKKPISSYWFGLEVLKTFESATQSLIHSLSSSTINIALDGSIYEIRRDSLQDATDAIKSACEICQDTTPGEGG